MQLRISVLVIAVLISLSSVGFGRKAAAEAEKSDISAKTDVPAFPYIAEIAAGNVNIRSGPGTNYYSCGKGYKGQRVKVVGSKFSWSQIVPPKGSFSWISRQYVGIDANDSGTGIVTSDGVRVYAGSDYVKPIHSTTVQPKQNKGDKVKLLGEERGDYYKIAPPAGAYLWVLTQYTEPLGDVGPEPQADEAAVVEGPEQAESKKLKEYYALEDQISAERDKPPAKQNYEDIKKALVEIAEDKAAGKAARYCEFALKKIGRYQLALKAVKESRLGDAYLQQAKDQIDKQRTERLAQIVDLGRFDVVGQFQTSTVYIAEAKTKYYRITDDSNKTICYTVPTGPAAQMDLSKFVGLKVGLVGTVEPHPETAGALVRFTEIVALE